MLGLIWAQGHGRAIGAGGAIPWHVPEDFAFFKRSTVGRPVIMGRRTWQSLPERFRPLPGRRNIVASRNGIEADGAEVVESLDAALALVATEHLAWVIGGARLYAAALPHADFAFVTSLGVDVDDADAFAPELPSAWREVASGTPLTSRTGIAYRFTAYARPDFDLPNGLFQP
ncbi:dihydrofolate reductase [Arcanobacterium haemolyticum]|nr:dihydrofolate reductase [Arcanobacterium haemolyticum]